MRRLLSSVFLFAALCVAGVPPSAASAGQLLPETIGSWTAGAPQAGTNGLPQELIAETRQTIEFRTYASGKRTLNIALQSYPDPSLAYEAYTAQLTVGMLPGDLKVPSAVDRADSRMILLIGNLIVDLRKSSDVSSAGGLSECVDLAAAGRFLGAHSGSGFQDWRGGDVWPLLARQGAGRRAAADRVSDSAACGAAPASS